MTQVSVEVLSGPVARQARMRGDVRDGLTSTPKSIPPVWFYDERGSRLFDEITRLPEYYLTRAERSILEARATEIVERSGTATLVEIGSGTSEKTRVILDAMAAAGSLDKVVLLDISETALREAALQLHRSYDVPVEGVVGDLRDEFHSIPSGGSRLWVFLGSTIGNFGPVERHQLFSRFARAMGPGDRLLLGADLVKDPARLIAAYDDEAGVTAAFNLNVLEVLNGELGADFDLDGFSHRAVWNVDESRVEMRLHCVTGQEVSLPAVDMRISLSAGEELLTEISTKFSERGLRDELAAAGFEVDRCWFDDHDDFMVVLAGLGEPTRGRQANG